MMWWTTVELIDFENRRNLNVGYNYEYVDCLNECSVMDLEICFLDPYTCIFEYLYSQSFGNHMFSA